MTAAVGNAVDQANRTQPVPQVIGRHMAAGIACSVVATVVFAELFDFVKDTGKNVTPFDRSILYWMRRHRTRRRTQAAKVLARLGSPPLIVGIGLGSALVGLFWRKWRGAAWTMPIAIMGAGVIIQGVKLIIKRPRPSFFTPLLHETGYSFPSGHSLIAMVVYGLFGYFALGETHNKWIRLTIRIGTASLVIAIGVSRVYVEVHYPTDVLAGWTAGVPWLIACIGLHEVLTRRWPALGEPVLTPQADAAGQTHSAAAALKTLLMG